MVSAARQGTDEDSDFFEIHTEHGAFKKILSTAKIISKLRVYS